MSSSDLKSILNDIKAAAGGEPRPSGGAVLREESRRVLDRSEHIAPRKTPMKEPEFRPDVLSKMPRQFSEPARMREALFFVMQNQMLKDLPMPALFFLLGAGIVSEAAMGTATLFVDSWRFDSEYVHVLAAAMIDDISHFVDTLEKRPTRTRPLDPLLRASIALVIGRLPDLLRADAKSTGARDGDDGRGYLRVPVDVAILAPKILYYLFFVYMLISTVHISTDVAVRAATDSPFSRLLGAAFEAVGQGHVPADGSAPPESGARSFREFGYRAALEFMNAAGNVQGADGYRPEILLTLGFASATLDDIRALSPPEEAIVTDAVAVYTTTPDTSWYGLGDALSVAGSYVRDTAREVTRPVAAPVLDFFERVYSREDEFILRYTAEELRQRAALEIGNAELARFTSDVMVRFLPRVMNITVESNTRILQQVVMGDDPFAGRSADQVASAGMWDAVLAYLRIPLEDMLRFPSLDFDAIDLVWPDTLLGPRAPRLRRGHFFMSDLAYTLAILGALKAGAGYIWRSIIRPTIGQGLVRGIYLLNREMRFLMPNPAAAANYVASLMGGRIDPGQPTLVIQNGVVLGEPQKNRLAADSAALVAALNPPPQFTSSSKPKPVPVNLNGEGPVYDI